MGKKRVKKREKRKVKRSEYLFQQQYDELQLIDSAHVNSKADA